MAQVVIMTSMGGFPVRDPDATVQEVNEAIFNGEPVEVNHPNVNSVLINLAQLVCVGER